MCWHLIHLIESRTERELKTKKGTLNIRFSNHLWESGRQTKLKHCYLTDVSAHVFAHALLLQAFDVFDRQSCIGGFCMHNCLRMWPK